MSRCLTPTDSFNDKIEIIAESGCWVWIGAVSEKGYGSLGVGNKKIQKAHRFSYEMYIGEIPKGLVIDHLCRVRCCVNPSHLEAVTSKENTKRGLNYNRNKTLCKSGHPLSGDNLYTHPKRKTRDCKICRNIAALKYKEKGIG